MTFAAPPSSTSMSIFEPDVPWPETIVDRVMRTRLCVADVFQRALEQELTTQAAQLRQEREAVKLRRVTSTAFLLDGQMGSGSVSQRRGSSSTFLGGGTSPQRSSFQAKAAAAFSSNGASPPVSSSSNAPNCFDDQASEITKMDGLDLAGKILRAVEVEVIKEVQKLADGLPRFLATQKSMNNVSVGFPAASRHASVRARQSSSAGNYWAAGGRTEDDTHDVGGRSPTSLGASRRLENLGDENSFSIPRARGDGGSGGLTALEQQELRDTHIRLHDSQALLAEQQHHIEALKAFCLKKDNAMNYIRSTIFSELSIVKEQLRMQQEDPQYTSNFVTIFDAWKVMEGDDPSGGKEQAVKIAKAEAAGELAKAHAAFGVQLRQKDEEIGQLRKQLEIKNGELVAAVASSASPKKGAKKGSIDSSGAAASTFMEQFQALTKDLAQRDVLLADAESDIKMLRAQITSLEGELSQHVDQQAKEESNTVQLVALRDAEITTKCQLIEELEQKLVHYDQTKSKLIFLEKALDSIQTKYDTECLEWTSQQETLTKQIEELSDLSTARESTIGKLSEELAATQRELQRATLNEQQLLAQSDADRAKLVADLRSTLSTRTAELEVAREHVADFRTESLQLRQQVRELNEKLEGSGTRSSPRSGGGGGGGGEGGGMLLGEPSHALLEQANLEAKLLIQDELVDVKKTLDVVRAENESLKRQLTTISGSSGQLQNNTGQATSNINMVSDPFSSISFELSTLDETSSGRRNNPRLSASAFQGGRRTLLSTDSTGGRAVEDGDDGGEITTVIPSAAQQLVDSGGGAAGGAHDEKYRQLRHDHQQLKKSAAEALAREQAHLTEIDRLSDEIELMKKRGVQKAVDSLLHKPVATYAFDSKQNRSSLSMSAAHASAQHHAKRRLSAKPGTEDAESTGEVQMTGQLSPRAEADVGISQEGDDEHQQRVLKIPSATVRTPTSSPKLDAHGGGKGGPLSRPVSPNPRRKTTTSDRPASANNPPTQDNSTSPSPQQESIDECPPASNPISTVEGEAPSPAFGQLDEGEGVSRIETTGEIKWLRERVLTLETDMARLHQELASMTAASQGENGPEEGPIAEAEGEMSKPSQQDTSTGIAEQIGTSTTQLPPLPQLPPMLPSTRPQSAQSDISAGGAAAVASYEADRVQELTRDLEVMKEKLAQSERRCSFLSRKQRAVKVEALAVAASTRDKAKISEGVETDATTSSSTGTSTAPITMVDDGEETCEDEVQREDQSCQTDLQGLDIEQLLVVALTSGGSSGTVSSPSRFAKGKSQNSIKPTAPPAVPASYATLVDDRRVVPGSRKPSLLQRQSQGGAENRRQDVQQFFVGGDSTPLVERRPSSALGIGVDSPPPAPQQVAPNGPASVKRASSALGNTTSSNNNAASASASLPPRPSTALGMEAGRVVTTALPSTLPNMIGRPGSSRSAVSQQQQVAHKAAERIAQARSASIISGTEDHHECDDDDEAPSNANNQVTLVRGFGDASKYPPPRAAGTSGGSGTILAISSHNNAVGFGGTTNAAAKQLATELLLSRKAFVDSSGIAPPSSAPQASSSSAPEGSLEGSGGGGGDVVPVEKLFPLAVLDEATPQHHHTTVDCRAQVADFYLGYGKDGAALRGVKEKIRQSINVEAFMARMMPTTGDGNGGGVSCASSHDNTIDRWNVSGMSTGTTTQRTEHTPTPTQQQQQQKLRPASGMVKPALKPSPNSAVPASVMMNRK